MEMEKACMRTKSAKAHLYKVDIVQTEQNPFLYVSGYVVEQTSVVDDAGLCRRR